MIDWIGINIGVSTEGHIYGSVQITPWFHDEISIGLDGVGYSRGVDIGDTSYDFEIKGGWGLIALVASPQILDTSRAVAY